MYHRFTMSEPHYLENSPMIDGEFDLFEINHDLGTQLRDSATANFYHDALDKEE